MDLFSSIGLQELVVVFIGPGKIAEFGTSAGKLLRKFKNISSALTSSLEKEILDENRQRDKSSSSLLKIPDNKSKVQPEEKAL